MLERDVDAETGAAAHVWSAIPIGDGGVAGAIPVFRRIFTVRGAPQAALLRVTFLGVGRVEINGVPVTEDVLEPGWQSYTHRLLYRTYDVADMLTAGQNIITAEVAPGWFSGRLGFLRQREIYGATRGVIAELDITTADGQQHVRTDESWEWSPGATLCADLYDGETFDARVTEESRRWVPATPVDFDTAHLEEAAAPPVRRIETLQPLGILHTPSGKTIVDFGRNIVGWTRLRVSGARGTEIELRHAEVLEGGELGSRPLRTARATDRYVIGGSGEEVWEPAFTYHGFRYVEVSGWPDDALLEGIEAVVLFSDMRRTGWFRTSNRLLAQLHANVVASTVGNFISIPTDCPQRDERLGWTGDIALFAPTALFLFDASDFLQSWLRDVALEQREDGRIPIFVPEVPFEESIARSVAQFGGV
ncbi:MAG: family 78 glycoside hydrolase catalytic domain, partial [Rhodococcus fascians]